MEKANHYRIAVRGMIKREDKYLLLERSKLARGEAGYWELPGGGLDFGESPQEALIREIKEETGLDAQVGIPLSVWHYMRGNHVEIIGMTFMCTVKEGDVVLSSEHISYRWLSLDDVKTKKIFPEFLNELEDMPL